MPCEFEPAPHRRLGYAPFEYLSILSAMESHGNGEACLSLYHAKSHDVPEPLTIPVFAAVFGEPEFTDLCFCPSNALNLLLVSNGEVWGAFPTHWMCVWSQSTTRKRIPCWRYILCRMTKRERDSAVPRFFSQWSFVEQADEYMVALLRYGNPSRSTLWPVQLQGPPSLEGWARICRGTRPWRGQNLCLDLPFTALVCDPVLETVIHCVTDRDVATITSYAICIFQSRLWKQQCRHFK